MSDTIVERLRERDDTLSHQAAAEIARLRCSLASWEAVAAIARGSMQQPICDEPDTIRNVSTLAPPSAPPHGEHHHE